MGVLVDSNVFIDILTNDSRWSSWSSDALRRALDESVVVISPIVYGELAAGIDTVEALDAVLPEDLYRREPLPYPAAFLAGVAHRQYKRNGGNRGTPLADFYIGAHAAVAGHRLLTRDPYHYRRHFPRLELIAPQSAG